MSCAGGSRCGADAVNPARQILYKIAVSGVPERVLDAVPALEQESYRHALRYVAGREREDAFRVVRALADEGLRASIDFFGERVPVAAEAASVAGAYVELARAVHELPQTTSLAVDLSHIGVDVSAEFCVEQLRLITAATPSWCRVEIGAEDAARTERILDVVLRVAAPGACLMHTLQANLRRSPDDARRLAAAGVAVRLVKGAYVEDPAVALPWGPETDTAYVRLADQLHADGAEVALATHDAGLREALLLSLPRCEVQMLMGVLPQEARALAARGHDVRLYVPYGPNWARYWLRRLAESHGA